MQRRGPHLETTALHHADLPNNSTHSPRDEEMALRCRFSLSIRSTFRVLVSTLWLAVNQTAVQPGLPTRHRISSCTSGNAQTPLRLIWLLVRLGGQVACGGCIATPEVSFKLVVVNDGYRLVLSEANTTWTYVYAAWEGGFRGVRLDKLMSVQPCLARNKTIN